MFKKVYLTGDYHAEASRILPLVKRLEKEGTNPAEVAVIILGDFGMNLIAGCGIPEYEDYFNKEKKKLEDTGVTFFVVRGNHDQRPTNLFNSENWHFEQMFDGPTYVENNYPHIHYAMDYPWVYNVNGYKTLVLPGAISVDIFFRLADEKKTGIKTWYRDEVMSDAEMEYARSLCRQNDWTFDMVLSHTCPAWCFPLSSPNWGAKQKMEKFFNELYFAFREKNGYKGWAWGHHHQDILYAKEGDKSIEACLYYKYIDVEDFMNHNIDGLDVYDLRRE